MSTSGPQQVPPGFADDPIASHSAQFGLARPADAARGHDVPSPDGIRPWNLRMATPLGSSTGTSDLFRSGGIRYDHVRQVAVTCDGTALSEVIIDATANSVSNLDGDEGPSEDWTYDYVGDDPGAPA